MLVIHYDEKNFNEIEVEVEDYLYFLMEKAGNESFFEYNKSPIIPSSDGLKIFMRVQKPGRQFGEEGENYRITIEKIE